MNANRKLSIRRMKRKGMVRTMKYDNPEQEPSADHWENNHQARFNRAGHVGRTEDKERE